MVEKYFAFRLFVETLGAIVSAIILAIVGITNLYRFIKNSKNTPKF